jgi:hypothetical protein
MSGGKRFVDILQVGTTELTFDPTRVLWVDNNISPPLPSPNGSENAPFATIQAAIDAAGTPSSIIDQALPYVIYIIGGVYDEDLVVPPYRSVVFVSLGLVLLGSAGRTVLISLTGGSVAPGVEGQITFQGGEQQNFQIAGQVVLTSTDAEDIELEFYQTKILGDGGGPATAGIDATGFTGGGTVTIGGQGSVLNGDSGGAAILGGPGAPVLLGLFRDSEFLNDLVVDSYGAFLGCRLEANLTTLAVPSQSGKASVTGFRDSEFDTAGGSVFPGGAGGTLELDSASYHNWIATASSVAGPETLVLIDQGLAGQTDYVAGTPADWLAAPPLEVNTAIDRIASAVAGLLGGGIP